MYMSYCKMEGTWMELTACLHDAEDHMYGDAEYAVSEREIQHFRWIIKEMYNWLCDMYLIDENGYLNEAGLDVICEAMRHAYNDSEEVR